MFHYWTSLIFGRAWCLPIAQTATFSISAARRQPPFPTVTSYLNTSHTCNCFLLGWEKNGHGAISWFHVSLVVHNSGTTQPTHEITDCTTYNLAQNNLKLCKILYYVLWRSFFVLFFCSDVYFIVVSWFHVSWWPVCVDYHCIYQVTK
jgi:hypothetical protein